MFKTLWSIQVGFLNVHDGFLRLTKLCDGVISISPCVYDDSRYSAEATFDSSSFCAISRNSVITINGVFSLLFRFFSQIRLWNFVLGFKSQENKNWGEDQLERPPCPPGVDFLGFLKKQKVLRTPKMTRKLINEFVNFVYIPSQLCAPQNFCWCQWGTEHRH